MLGDMTREGQVIEIIHRIREVKNSPKINSETKQILQEIMDWITSEFMEQGQEIGQKTQSLLRINRN